MLVWLVKALLRKMFEHFLFLCPSLCQVIDGLMPLALCLQVVSQAPQHFNSLKLHALAMVALQKGQMTDGGVWCVQVHWLVPVQVPVTDATRGAGTERTDGRPQESNRGGICLDFFNECRNLNPANKTSLGPLLDLPCSGFYPQSLADNLLLQLIVNLLQTFSFVRPKVLNQWLTGCFLSRLKEYIFVSDI